MKKVVVVVSEMHHGELIEGKDLQIINKNVASVAGITVPDLLVIMDGEENLAVFNKWLFWKKLE